MGRKLTVNEVVYPKKPRPPSKRVVSKPWRVDYDLAYDGGGEQWIGYYYTKTSARIFAWWHNYITSWGGSVTLTKNSNRRT